MNQTELDLGIPTASTGQKRDFHGFAQYREATCERWRFYVCGFDSRCSDGCDGYCHVMRTDGTTEIVSIDGGGRIQIYGRRYGPRHWDH